MVKTTGCIDLYFPNKCKNINHRVTSAGSKLTASRMTTRPGFSSWPLITFFDLFMVPLSLCLFLMPGCELETNALRPLAHPDD